MPKLMGGEKTLRLLSGNPAWQTWWTADSGNELLVLWLPFSHL